MPSTDREVFAYLTSDPDTSGELDFLTYAFYGYEKFQWLGHYEQARGKPPDAAEIERRIADITTARFINMRQQAGACFNDAAPNYLRDDIGAQKEAAVRASILGDVRAAGAFWRQMAVALVTAILAPPIIGAVIGAALTHDRIIPTATDLPHHVSVAPATPWLRVMPSQVHAPSAAPSMPQVAL